MTSRGLLLCTLGTSWAAIPEVFGWLAPRSLDLYRHHPQPERLDADRRLLDLFTAAPAA